MKLLVIADLHGLSIWESLIKEHKPDKVVFLGDYVDSFTISDEDIVKNLQNIIEYKKNNPNTTTLLLGNHDIQYLWEGNRCSGYRKSYSEWVWALFKDNLELFKIIHKEWYYLFSHAGVTNWWWWQNEDMFNDMFPDGWVSDITDFNDVFFKSHYQDRFFQVGKTRWGTRKYWGPFWADKWELIVDYILWYTQVVGHTKCASIEEYGEDLIFCDTLEYGDWKPLILNIEND